MLTEEQFLLAQLVVKLGISGAISVLDGIKNAKTIDDALVALRETQKLTAADFKEKVQE